MKIVITGLSGSGKTTILKSCGIKKIYFADSFVKENLYSNPGPILDFFKREYPEVILENKVNTKKLGFILFKNKNKLEQVNKLIAPFVQKWILNLPDNSLIEMAAYINNQDKYKNSFNNVILIKRKDLDMSGKFEHIKQEEFQPISNQNIEADYIIENNGSVQEAAKELKNIFDKIKKNNKE